MEKRVLTALLLLALLAGSAAAQEPPKFGWGGSVALPADLRGPLLAGAPEAAQASKRMTVVVLADAADLSAFQQLLKKNELARGFWLDAQANGPRTALSVWLVDAGAGAVNLRAGDIGRQYDAPLDLACRLAWEALEPPVAPAAAKLAAQARAAAAAGDPGAADQFYRQAAIISERANSLCREAGQMQFAAGRPDAAIPWFQTALARDPNDFSAELWLARVYETTGDREQEQAATEAALRVGPRTPSVLLLAAAQYKRLERVADAETLLIEAARRAPADLDVQTSLLNVAEIQHDWAVAASALRVLIPAQHLGREFEHELVDYELLSRDFATAEPTIAAMRQRYPTDEMFFRDYVFLLAETGKYAEAEPLLHQMLAQPGRDQRSLAWAHAMLGRVYYHSRRFDQAAAELTTACALDPYDDQSERLLRESIELSGDKGRAFSYLETRLYYGRPLTNDELDRFVALAQELAVPARAETALKHLIERGARRQDRTAAAITLGRLLEKQGRLREAIDVYRTLLRGANRPANVLFEIGRLYYLCHDPAAGAGYFRELASVSFDARLLPAAARIVQQAGDPQFAADLLAATYAADPTATEAGVLTLESSLLANADRDHGGLIAQLDPTVKQPDERELLYWLELYWAAISGHNDYFAQLLPHALKFVASRPTTRVELAKWPPVVAERLAGPRLAEMQDLLAVFARRLPAKDFARKYRIEVPGW